MTAQIFDFPDKGEQIWRFVGPAVYQIALDRSGSKDITERVVKATKEVCLRCIPTKFSFTGELTETLSNEFSEYIHQIAGAFIAELTTALTDVEILALERGRK